MAEFFDIGHSRTLPSARRPQAAALLVAMADPEREFDAIVFGSSERAFHGSQFSVMAPLFEHYGVAVWVPELGGAVDPLIAGHEELMILLGLLAKREITRTRIRVRTAGAVQTREQRRYLGGRPPYGYRLVDAGPAPEPGMGPARSSIAASRCRSSHGSDRAVDHRPALGRVQRRAEHPRPERSAIPCPSAADPDRNAHHSGEGWTLTTVRAVLANPRYTGRQVRNRQRTDHELLDPDNTTFGHRAPAPLRTRRWSASRTSSRSRTSG
ncbi:recombinase family protein [Kitasatospora acidiphila]|uniref:recombinase family protein n=1 Tax=Kitasatospora acidiphila TaxID=2567942 RepID=UPI001E3B9C07|nr:recombinase family protein [Kitasatospora acidiphila]